MRQTIFFEHPKKPITPGLEINFPIQLGEVITIKGENGKTLQKFRVHGGIIRKEKGRQGPPRPRGLEVEVIEVKKIKK